MKNLLFTLISLCVFASAMTAQSTFTMTPNPATCSAPPTAFDVVAYSKIKSKGKAVDLRWNRRIISLPEGATCAVCDLNACYGDTTSTSVFTLPAGAEGEISLHYYNWEENPGLGLVQLRITNILDPKDSVTVVFVYNATVSTAEKQKAAQVVVAPNPVQDFVTLQNAVDVVGAVRILANDGREVSYMQATSDQRYDLSSLNTGIYFLVMENAKGQALRAVELQKL